METSGIVSLIIIIINTIVSYKGFSNYAFFNKNAFEVDGILIAKEYKRLITSGFLHVSWTHLLFNMISLYVFSGSLESHTGIVNYIIIYTTSLLGGNLFSLFIHRNHGDYTAVGASGAVCGIIFSSIALFPGMSIGFFGIPISIPGWLYGLGYVLYSIYGIRSKSDNIGHEAHLGGALAGMTAAIIMYPSSLFHNYLTIALIAIPTLIFIYIILTRPHFLFVDNFFFKTHEPYDIDEKYHTRKKNQQEEIDRILDKIHKKGVNSLTKKEKETLDSLANHL